MELKVYIPHTVTIPDDKLAKLERGARKRQRLVFADGTYPMESIVHEALDQGVIELPTGHDFVLDADLPGVKDGRLQP